MPVTHEEHLEELNNPMAGALAKEGITPSSLAKQLKAELGAKVSKTVKLKGSVGSGQVARGVKVLAVSGVVTEGEEGQEFGTGDTLLEFKERAWDVQARARMDAQKLMGLYPVEQVEVGGSIAVNLAEKLNKALERAHGGASQED